MPHVGEEALAGLEAWLPQVLSLNSRIYAWGGGGGSVMTCMDGFMEPALGLGRGLLRAKTRSTSQFNHRINISSY